MHRRQHGFGIVEIIIGFVVLGLLATLVVFALRPKNETKQQDSQQQTQNQQQGRDTTPPVLFNFGVADLNSIDISPQATRDFTKSGHKGMYMFGDILPGTPVRHNPNFEFASVKEGTRVVAALNGIVGFIKEQPESKDFEVFLMTSEQSEWVIGYDHLTNLKVKKGDSVTVGTWLGEPARQNNGLLRYEFQVNKNNGNQDGMHICPSTLLDSSVKAPLLKSLGTVQDEWESMSGLELYDTTKQDPVGCLMKEMTPAYAQGQQAN